MTQEISSLMDGELAPEEAQRAIKACSASAAGKVDWHLYHVIGDAMRGQAPRSLALPKDVIEALQGQPTVLAPQRRRIPANFTRVALAAAASVATVGVVGWIGSQGGQGTSAPVAAKAGLAPVDSVRPPEKVTVAPVLFVSAMPLPSPSLPSEIAPPKLLIPPVAPDTDTSCPTSSVIVPL